MTATDPMPLPVQPGDVVAGKYRIERVLAQGGMGVVVVANHEALGQRVAIKLLLPEAAGSGAALARFLREAQSAAQIQSPHVCRVFDVGSLPSGQPYMVMELLQGADLATELEQRRTLPVTEAVGHVIEALDAIVDAHHRGIVHRDIKPANLFLCRRDDGRVSVKVLDFGISKIDPRAGSAPSFQLTTTQALLGSPAYMSPEQVRSTKDVDARTDIWALGVILYESLAGGPLFGGQSLGEVFSKIREDPIPPLSSVRADVPAELDRIVARCLQRKPEDRFASAADLRDALSAFLAAALDGARSGDARLSSPRARGGSDAALARTATGEAMSAETVGRAPDAPVPMKQGPTSKVWMAAAIALVGGALGAWVTLGRGAAAPAVPALVSTDRPAVVATEPTTTVVPALPASGIEPSVSAAPEVSAAPPVTSASAPAARPSASAPSIPRVAAPRSTGARPAGGSLDDLLGKRR